MSMVLPTDSSDVRPAEAVDPAATPPQVRGFQRAAYFSFAGFFLVLGMAGVVLPGLPTTPFLLLMSYFLIRTSPRLHDRVLQFPIIGQPIQEWRQRRGIRLPIKILATVMVVAAVSLSVALNAGRPPLQTAIVLLAAIGMWVVWRLPTIR